MAQVERSKDEEEDDKCVNVKPGALPQLPFLLPALLMPAPACLGSGARLSQSQCSVWQLGRLCRERGASSREEAQSRCRESRVHCSSAALLAMVVVLYISIFSHP